MALGGFHQRGVQDLSVAFRSDRQLRQFILTDVASTGRVLGRGSYGSVEEVLYKHVVCAGKKLHEALIDAENEGVPEIVSKYLRECQLISSLHHPNITQFLGLCFLPGTRLPLLVTERLETSLDDVLEHVRNLPLSFKRSILENVAGGLFYLHDRTPPIIHRDLTAKNVLLTSSLAAKITDLGNSRIVNLGPDQMARSLSGIPGTLVYMPPEAMDDIHHYGPSLDIFSFGHLALYTIVQEFPKLRPSTFADPEGSDNIQARSEVERRGVYIENLRAIANQVLPSLVVLVEQCLHNTPDQRPTTEQLLTGLQQMKAQVEGEYGSVVANLDLMKVRLSRDLRVKDRRIEELTQQKDSQTAELQTTIEEKEGLLQEKDEQIGVKEREVVALDDRIQHLLAENEDAVRQHQSDMEAKYNQNQRLQDQIRMLEDQLNERIEAHEGELRSKDNEIQRLNNSLSSSRELNQQLQDSLDALNSQLAEEKEQYRSELESKGQSLQSLLDVRNEQFQQLTELEEEVELLKTQLVARDNQITQQQNEIKSKDAVVQQLKDEIRTRVDEIAELKRGIEANRHQLKEVQGASKNTTNGDMCTENSRLQEELRKCQRLLATNKALTSNPDPTFDWRSSVSVDMGEYEMSGYIQSVVINGVMYVGGGKARRHEHNAIVMEFSMGKWSMLPPYKASFGMAAVKKQLVLVGGEDSIGVTRKIGVWYLGNNRWTHPYPEMTTARSHCSALAFDEWLIVAGGKSSQDFLSSMEVLNTDTKQWHMGPSIPIPWHSMKTAVVGNTAYFMGGETPDAECPTLVYSLSYRDLMSQSQLSPWNELPDHPLGISCPLSIGQSLLTVGGINKEEFEAETSVYLFKPGAEVAWVKVGDLPEPPRCYCTCMAVHEVIVAGGFDLDKKLARVDTASLL